MIQEEVHNILGGLCVKNWLEAGFLVERETSGFGEMNLSLVCLVTFAKGGKTKLLRKHRLLTKKRGVHKHVLKSGKNQGFSDFQIAKFSYRKKNFRAARENFSRTTGEDIFFAVVGPQCGWSYFSLPPPQCLIQESRFQGGQLVLLPNIISSTADQGRH